MYNLKINFSTYFNFCNLRGSARVKKSVRVLLQKPGNKFNFMASFFIKHSRCSGLCDTRCTNQIRVDTTDEKKVIKLQRVLQALIIQNYSIRCQKEKKRRSFQASHLLQEMSGILTPTAVKLETVTK